MLYIKFHIQDIHKFKDFEKLYKHMCSTRLGDFNFQPEEKEYDWENLNEQEMSKALDELLDDKNPQEERCMEFMPDYAQDYLESYLSFDQERAADFAFTINDIFNYLEVGFEVDFNNLLLFEDNSGIIEFSTGNYPFGGIERLLITLKAFEITPIESFNGFTILEFHWDSDFEYETIEFPEKARNYIESFKR